MSKLDALKPYAKAIVGFIAPGAVVIGNAVLDSSAGGEHITTGEWVTAVVAAIVTAAAVWRVPNRPADVSVEAGR